MLLVTFISILPESLAGGYGPCTPSSCPSSCSPCCCSNCPGGGKGDDDDDGPPPCVPDCSGKECGGDGCGGSCGTCTQYKYSVGCGKGGCEFE
ncbi:MAG: hypothetical protein NDI94_03770, partial [Candidatus Woesearchaeota archaeon]|nr:hypothetical protein [Candidatus Woesearchaeota archaeon]